MRGDYASFFLDRAPARESPTPGATRHAAATSCDDASARDLIDENPVAWLIGRYRAHHRQRTLPIVLTVAPMLLLLARVYAPAWFGLRPGAGGRFGLFVCYIQAVLFPACVIFLTLSNWNYYASVVWIRRRRAWDGLFLSRLTPPEFLAGLAEAAQRQAAVQRGCLLRGATLAALPFPDLLIVAAVLLALHHRIDLARLASRWLLTPARREALRVARENLPRRTAEIDVQPTLLLVGVRSYGMAVFMAIMPMASIAMLVGLLTISWETLGVVAVALFFFLMWGSYLESPDASRDDDPFASSLRAWLRRPPAAPRPAVARAAVAPAAAVTPPPRPQSGA